MLGAIASEGSLTTYRKKRKEGRDKKKEIPREGGRLKPSKA